MLQPFRCFSNTHPFRRCSVLSTFNFHFYLLFLRKYAFFVYMKEKLLACSIVDIAFFCFGCDLNNFWRDLLEVWLNYGKTLMKI